MVFRRGPHHGRTADIDIFDRVFETAVGIGDGLLKRVEVDDDQVDSCDIVLAHHFVVDAAASENAAVNHRMQGFYATRHHFRKAGVIGNLGNRDTVFGDQSGGTAGGQQLDIVFLQGLRQFDDAGFI